MDYIVYKLISPSGKCYIGYSSKTISERLNVHKRDRQYLINKGKTIPRFYAAWKKYPIEDWKQEVLHESTSKTKIQILEKEEISNHQSLNEEFGYNMASGGDGGNTGRNGEQWKRTQHSQFLKQQYIDNPELRHTTSTKRKDWHKELKQNKKAYKQYCKIKSDTTPTGKNHWNHTGMWVVNHNEYDSLSEAVKAEGVSESTIVNKCNNPDEIVGNVTKINKNKRCNFVKGHTNRQCGFYRIGEKDGQAI